MSTRHSDLRKDKYNAMMCMFWLVSPDPGVKRTIPGLQLPNPSLTPVKGWESPLSRPSDHTKPAGLLAKGARGPAAQADNRKPRPGPGLERGRPRPPPPRCSTAPRRPRRTGGWGWKRELVLPGTQRRCGLALRPRQRKDTS